MVYTDVSTLIVSVAVPLLAAGMLIILGSVITLIIAVFLFRKGLKWLTRSGK